MTSMRLIAALVGLFALNACTSPTGLIDAATTPAEDRSFADSSADAELKLTINKRFLDESGKSCRRLWRQASGEAGQTVPLRRRLTEPYSPR